MGGVLILRKWWQTGVGLVRWISSKSKKGEQNKQWFQPISRSVFPMLQMSKGVPPYFPTSYPSYYKFPMIEFQLMQSSQVSSLNTAVKKERSVHVYVHENAVCSEWRVLHSVQPSFHFEQCLYRMQCSTVCRIVEGTVLILHALPSAHVTRHNVTCFPSSSHASHVTCVMQILIPCLTCPVSRKFLSPASHVAYDACHANASPLLCHVT